MKVLFVANFSPIVADMPASMQLYVDTLGLPLEGDYPMTEKLDGVKHFSLWSLSGAAQSCFGTPQWPADVRIPQANLEFEVDDVEAAAKELQAKGHTLLHAARTEPWQQTIARLLSPEGLLVGVCHTPWLHPAGNTE